MRRQLDPVDLMVAVGLCATVLGGYLMFLSTSGTIGAASAETASIGLTERTAPNAGDMMTSAQWWVQPALGQAIVTDYLLEREFSRKTMAASAEFNRATVAGQRLEASPFEHFERVGAYAAVVEADHVARVQYVLGRRIVNFTARGVRTGILSPAQIGDRYNRRMIRRAQLAANRMDGQFMSHREPMKGWAIVAASQDHAQFAGQVQHRIGSAIVHVTQVQQVSDGAIAGAQEQLASVALASIHSEQVADRFARLAADFSGPGSQLPVSEPQSWPEVPAGLLLAASMTLVGLFFAGLLMPSTRREGEMREREPGESAEALYRKTA